MLQDQLVSIASNVSRQLNQGKGKEVKTEPDRIEVGGGWCLLPQQSFTTPRGKFDVEFLPNGNSIVLHNKSISYRCTLSGAICLPSLVLNATKPKVLLLLETPLSIGKQTTKCLLFTPTPSDSKLNSLQVTTTKISPNARIPMGSTLEDTPLELFEAALIASTSFSMEHPSAFKSSEGKSGIKCYDGVNDGVLYPLANGVAFIQKPLKFLHKTEIENIEMDRSCSSGTRNFDLNINMKDGVCHQMRMIEQAELDFISAFVESSKINETNDAIVLEEQSSDEDSSFISSSEEEGSSDEGSSVKYVTRRTRGNEKLETLSDVEDAEGLEAEIEKVETEEEDLSDNASDDESHSSKRAKHSI